MICVRDGKPPTIWDLDRFDCLAERWGGTTQIPRACAHLK